PHFNGVDDLYVELPWVSFFNSLKDPDAIGIDEGVMCFTAAELKEKVFDPVVERVLALIRDQLDKATKCSAIFLVGGFGSSTYLLNRVTKEFGTKVKIVSKPHRPEIAVVFGAVYAGMEPRKITARVTRCCYGVGVMDTFVFGVDPIESLRTRIDGLMCDDRFSTIVEKGQLVKLDQCVTNRYAFTYEGTGNSRGGSIIVYVVDGDPPRYTTNLSSSAFIRIPDIFKATDPAGHKVPCELKFYFGLSEIRVEAIVLGRSHQTRLQFDDDGVKPSR
ncbi:Heat shock 70 kDa protein 12A, partial [Actinomortierella ambigua]